MKKVNAKEINGKVQTMVYIFDLDNLDDLPDSCKKKLLSRKKRFREYVQDLFNIKSILSTNEVVVGLFRLYKIEKDFSAVSALLTVLVNARFIQRVANTPHTYEKIIVDRED